ncbi:unnamed protein product [Moneuplotes crassus]|uniref:Uncharacterized protein n=1 Tax=Euplotes crassus TaxID=5936 RepID=A0AAD1XSA9_EUPCR|nr:unnamed protein product [Moneuplotes crassus]
MADSKCADAYHALSDIEESIDNLSQTQEDSECLCTPPQQNVPPYTPIGHPVLPTQAPEQPSSATQPPHNSYITGEIYVNASEERGVDQEGERRRVRRRDFRNRVCVVGFSIFVAVVVVVVFAAARVYSDEPSD